MAAILSSVEVWQLAVIKLLFLSFIGLGLFFYYKKYPRLWLVALLAAFSGLTYGVIAWQAQVTWWGLVGDEVFVTSYLQKIASGFFWSDFFHTNLPPSYPPLYFWLMGTIGFIFRLNGVALAHLGVILTLT